MCPFIFSYGSLTDPKIDELVLGHREFLYPAILPDYKKIDGDYPTIQESPGDRVKGESFFVNMEELAELQTWEEKYRLQPVKLQDGLRALAFIKKG